MMEKGTPSQEEMRAAARADVLLGAFKYITKMPGKIHKPEEFCHIEEIITNDRKELFWEKWRQDEPDAPKAGFFVRYIRPTTLKYKPKKYRKEMIILTDWLEHIMGRHATDVAPPEMRDVLMALADIQRQLMIDGGKNAFDRLNAADPDTHEYIRKRAKKANQTTEEYIRANNERIEQTAVDVGLPVDEYLLRKNHEVNRRKDVLQVLVAQMAENIHEINKSRSR